MIKKPNTPLWTKVGDLKAFVLLNELRTHLEGKMKPVSNALMMELSGLSEFQARRYRGWLVKNGFIETEQHLTKVMVDDWPSARNFNHVRLTLKGEQVFQ